MVKKTPEIFTAFVPFSDNYFSIPLWVHSFLISLHWDSYALICLPLAYPSDIYLYHTLVIHSDRPYRFWWRNLKGQTLQLILACRQSLIILNTCSRFHKQFTDVTYDSNGISYRGLYGVNYTPTPLDKLAYYSTTIIFLFAILSLPVAVAEEGLEPTIAGLLGLWVKGYITVLLSLDLWMQLRECDNNILSYCKVYIKFFISHGNSSRI
jgi:hypothetical protein